MNISPIIHVSNSKSSKYSFNLSFTVNDAWPQLFWPLSTLLITIVCKLPMASLSHSQGFPSRSKTNLIQVPKMGLQVPKSKNWDHVFMPTTNYSHVMPYQVGETFVWCDYNFWMSLLLGGGPFQLFNFVRHFHMLLYGRKHGQKLFLVDLKI